MVTDDRSWRTTGSGLYLPDGAPASLDWQMLQATKVQARATRIGALTSVVALIATAVALTISISAWHDQQQLSRQQLQLNAFAQRSEQEIYSSRVAMWAALGTTDSSILPDGLDVTVQNRSPVPLRDVAVVAMLTSGQTGAVVLGDMAPCSSEAVRIAPPEGQSFTRTQREWAGYTELALTFTETSRSWMLTSHSLTPANSGQSLANQVLRQAAPREQPIDGCGS